MEATSFAVDKKTALEFRNAVEKRYPNHYGMIKIQVKKAIEERTKALLMNE